MGWFSKKRSDKSPHKKSSKGSKKAKAKDSKKSSINQESIKAHISKKVNELSSRWQGSSTKKNDGAAKENNGAPTLEREPEVKKKRKQESSMDVTCKDQAADLRTIVSRRLDRDHDRKVEISNCDIDESAMKKVIEKLKKVGNNRSVYSLEPIDAKSKILMDRVIKKPIPLDYKCEKSLFLVNEYSLFGRPLKEKKMEDSEFYDEDSYCQVPRLKNVRKMPEENIYTQDGVPFWAVNPEPTEDDLSDVEPPIYVGSEYLEMYNEKRIVLQTIKNSKLVLNELQPLSELKMRDKVHFGSQMVFSNTIRSLIQCQQGDPQLKGSGEIGDESPVKKISHKFDTSQTEPFVYSRSNPIQSVRELRRSNSKERTPRKK